MTINTSLIDEKDSSFYVVRSNDTAALIDIREEDIENRCLRRGYESRENCEESRDAEGIIKRW